MSGPEQNLQQVLEDLEEADEVTPLPYTPPGILRGRPPVGSAVVAPAEELHPAQEQQKKRRKKDKAPQRKAVPPWKLFRFSTWLDKIMIVIGMVMAIASGVALPGHILLFGRIINRFVYYEVALEQTENITMLANASGLTCDAFVKTISSLPADMSGAMGNTSANMSLGLFCEGTNTSVFEGLSQFICDPTGTLESEITLFALYYVGIGTGVLIASFIATLFWNITAYRQSRKMRVVFYRAILRQEIGWFDVNETAQLYNRLQDDVEKIQAGIGDKMAVFLQYLSNFVSGFVIAFIFDWKLALVMATMLPVLAIMAAALATIISSFSVREQTAYASAAAIAEQAISSIRTVVSFGGEQKEAAQYAVQLKKARNEGVKKGLLTSLVLGGLYCVIFSALALGFWYGGQLTASCELSAGDVVTVLFAIVIGGFSLGTALPELETFATASGAAAVVFDIIDRKSMIDPMSESGVVPDSLVGNIEFSDVVFHYPARPDVQIMSGLDLRIKSGQTVALVGPSGCGKSTILQLLLRFYNADAGLITLDGVDVRTLNLKWLRSQIGLVFQEPVLFATSITENIRFGREDATMEEVEQAAKNANAYDFIMTLPDTFDTHVGDMGTQLSGGQKQRIAIARALVANPKILLLDEATSALDTESEKIVQDALDRAREGRTTIVIAHRLSTIRSADIIIGIENGQVVEMGSHAELMDHEGLYYELVTAQTIEEEEKEEEHDSMAQFCNAVKRSYSRRQSSQSLRKHPSFTRRTSWVKPSYRRQQTSQALMNFTQQPSWAKYYHRQQTSQSLMNFTQQPSMVKHSYSRQQSSQSFVKHPSFMRQASWMERFDSRQQSSKSSMKRPGFRQQASTHSSHRDAPGPTDVLSRFSLEDITSGTHPSPGPTPIDEPEAGKVVRFVEVEDDAEEGGTSKRHSRGSWWKLLWKKKAAGDEDLPQISFWELLKLNQKDWYLVLVGVVMSAILGCLFPILAILFSDVLRVLGGNDADTIRRETTEIAFGLVGLAAGSFIVYFLATFSLSVAGERLTKRLRLQSFQAILRQDISWFDDWANSTGALTTRLAVDASLVKGVTGLRLGTALQTMFGFVAALVIAFTASWELTLVLMFVFPLLGTVAYLEVRAQRGRSEENKEQLEGSSYTTVESINDIHTVAGLSIEERFLASYVQQLRGPFRDNMYNVLLAAVVYAIAQSLTFYIYAAGYRFGAFLVIEGRASYDDIFRVFGAVVFTALTLGRDSSFAPNAGKAQISASRIMHLLRMDPPIDSYSSDGEKPASCNGKIDASVIHFRYPSRPDVPVLQGLSVGVEHGHTLALVGPSGCGKSTVVSLVERFYDPDSGTIELDGHNLRNLNVKWLRSQIGLVSQEPVLFDTSIAENVRYGANFREVTDEEVIEAAKAANIHTFIETLPEGYSTNVGAKGTQLSGGQKQRIAIARALVRDPKILLLDEATSALDTESEKIVQDALDRAREGRTTIVVAHRLSTIYGSDSIAVIHNGQVIEQGRHGELMEKQGAYYHLNTVQLKDVDEL